MDIISLIITSVFVILVFTWFTQNTKVKNGLPGPIGLPFVGYLPFLTKRPEVTFSKLAKIYGPVYKIRLGFQDVVILCGFKSIQEAFNDDAFMGRPNNMPLELSEDTIRTRAILGLPWKQQRRFSLHALRDLGFCKTQMEEHMKEEIFEVLERLDQRNNAPFNMMDIISASVSNNVASLLFGKRMKFDDPKRQRLDKLITTFGILAGFTNWQRFFPRIRSFTRYFNLGNQGKMTRAINKVRDYCREEIVEHGKTLDPNNIRDFIDRYLLEVEKKREDSNSGFKKDVLKDLSGLFFMAGSLPVRHSINWALLMAADFPEVQKKIHQEIDEVLGRDRFPTWQDRLQMPYTEAAILEIMRLRTILPINPTRCTLKDTELNGYFVPKNSIVLAIFYTLDHDESLWGEDAHKYRPERFLSEDEKEVVKPEYFIPFSVGKRQCPGKLLAKIEIFLYFVAILQKFKLSMPPGKRANFEGVLGNSVHPEEQEIFLELR